MSDLITMGDEAPVAICELCNTEDDVSSGVCCEACGGYFCRRPCWNKHWCDVLTDRNGRIVKIGDKLRYPERAKVVFTLVEALPSYVRVRAGKGERSNGEIIPIHIRLMELI